MRLSIDNEADAVSAPPLDKELKRRLAAVAKLSPGILLEDKGYSLALHYRLAPHAEKAIYEAVSLIRADLPNAPIEVLPGKFVCEIKHSGFTKATGVRELMKHEPFKGRRPIFIGDDVTDETVFAIMPDMNGLAFSVGRRAMGVNGHFDAPNECAHVPCAAARRLKVGIRHRHLGATYRVRNSSSASLHAARATVPNPALCSEIVRLPGGKPVPTRTPDFGFNWCKG
ncbi:trehalose-6-phosphatase [Bradyrhizobium sp. GM7.3]